MARDYDEAFIESASYREEIRCLVSENRGLNPGIFGSVLHGRDSETSDLDLLFDPASETSLLDIARIQVRLEDLLGVHVDVHGYFTINLDLVRETVQRAVLALEVQVKKLPTQPVSR